MAAPHVTGAIGLLYGYLAQQGQSLTPAQVIERVGATGDPTYAMMARTSGGRRLNAYNLLTNTRKPLLPFNNVTLFVSTNKPTYAPGERVNITIRGTRSNFPIVVEIARPDGVTLRSQRTLPQAGTLMLTIFVPRNNASGTYTVSVTGGSGVEEAGLVITPASTTFSVN